MQSNRQSILCVTEDEDACASLLSSLSDYEVKKANTVADALVLARGGRFDLYLVAKNLPDGMGVDLCQKIRAFDPHTLILFLTHSACDDDWSGLGQAGVEGFFVNAGGQDALADAVARLMPQTGDPKRRL